jgi:hypothetical protein
MIQRIFRAKDCNHNKWVFGSLLVGAEHCFICWENKNQNAFGFVTVRVIPNTVGMISGYEDIYSNALYEDDVITSGHGFEYVVILTNKGFRAQAPSGILYEIDWIYQPVKKTNIHDGK